MITLPDDTYTRQKWFIWAVLLALILVPIALTLSWRVFGWPGLPEWEKSEPEHYAERITLLKYMISLGLSIIGATWFLATKTSSQVPRNDSIFRPLSWAWTFLGIAILAAFVELYFNYKGYFSWHVSLEDLTVATFKRVRYYWVLRCSGMSYLVCDTSFFVGAVLLVLAAIKVLHKDIFAERSK